MMAASQGFIILFIAIWFLSLLSLHFLKKDFTPYNHTCSEYANGKLGFIMNIAFFAMAIANILFAVRFWNNNLFVGVLFAVIAVGFIGLGTFKADIIISNKETAMGRIHLLFGFIAMLAINIATFALASQNSDILLWIFAWIVVLSFLFFVISLNIKTPICFGIAQRVFMLIITIWFCYAAIKLAH
jgi:hypothetical protein